MRLGATLTKDTFGTTGLVTFEDWNPHVPSAEYQPSVLKEFAEQLSDVDGRVEVSVQNLEKHDDGQTAKALVGRVTETDEVACVAAPLIGSDGGDD